MERLTGVLTAAGPRRVWVAAFCYLRCWEGLLFFAFVIDVWSRRVVTWQLAGHMRTDPVLDALRTPLSRRAHGVDVELVDHSDAGSQYTSYAFTRVLDEHAGSTPVDRIGRSTTGRRWSSSKWSSLRPRATTCRLCRLHTSMKIGTENPGLGRSQPGSLAAIFVPGHFGVEQSTATVLLVLIEADGLLGTLVGGRLPDVLLRRGRLNARVVVAAVGYDLNRRSSSRRSRAAGRARSAARGQGRVAEGASVRRREPGRRVASRIA